MTSYNVLEENERKGKGKSKKEGQEEGSRGRWGECIIAFNWNACVNIIVHVQMQMQTDASSDDMNKVNMLASMHVNFNHHWCISGDEDKKAHHSAKQESFRELYSSLYNHYVHESHCM